MATSRTRTVLGLILLVSIFAFDLAAQTDSSYPSLYLKDFGPSLPRISKKDFQIGSLSLKMSYDTVVSRYGHPDSVANFPEDWSEFTAYYFPKFVVWTNKHSQKVWTLDIYDPTFITSRGVKIGDSVALIDRVYPTKTINLSKDRFGRVGPYDYKFANYSEYRLYDFDVSADEGWVLILFTQHHILTKILLYVGVPE
jgi:hypothetical protein